MPGVTAPPTAQRFPLSPRRHGCQSPAQRGDTESCIPEGPPSGCGERRSPAAAGQRAGSMQTCHRGCGSSAKPAAELARVSGCSERALLSSEGLPGRRPLTCDPHRQEEQRSGLNKTPALRPAPADGPAVTRERLSRLRSNDLQQHLQPEELLRFLCHELRVCGFAVGDGSSSLTGGCGPR